MFKQVALAAAIVMSSTLVATAAEPIKDSAMCQARLATHQQMLASSDSGEKANNLVSNLIQVFEHLCETEAYDEALLVGNTIRGMLASEN